MEYKPVEINGRKLLFGLAGFYEHVRDATDKDPIKWLTEQYTRFQKNDDGTWAVMSFMDDVGIYAYAGINLQLDIEDKPNITLAQARKWVRTLEISQLSEILNAVTESLAIRGAETNGVSGELIAQTL